MAVLPSCMGSYMYKHVQRGLVKEEGASWWRRHEEMRAKSKPGGSRTKEIQREVERKSSRAADRGETKGDGQLEQ